MNFHFYCFNCVSWAAIPLPLPLPLPAVLLPRSQCVHIKKPSACQCVICVVVERGKHKVKHKLNINKKKEGGRRCCTMRGTTVPWWRKKDLKEDSEMLTMATVVVPVKVESEKSLPLSLSLLLSLSLSMPACVFILGSNRVQSTAISQTMRDRLLFVQPNEISVFLSLALALWHVQRISKDRWLKICQPAFCQARVH